MKIRRKRDYSQPSTQHTYMQKLIAPPHNHKAKHTTTNNKYSHNQKPHQQQKMKNINMTHNGKISFWVHCGRGKYLIDPTNLDKDF